MSNLQINSGDDLRKLLESRDLRHVHVGITDHNGQVRGKYISKAKLLGALDHGMAMTRNFAAVDFKDVIYPVQGLIVNGDGFGDGLARIVPESCREIPWEAPDRNLFLLIEHCDKGADFDARVLCSRMLRRAEALGYLVYSACELEFRLLDETPRSLNEKSFVNLELATPSSAYLSVMQQAAWSEFFGDLTRDMEHLGVPIESAHWELGSGFVELVLAKQEGMRAVDNAVIYKTFAKAFAMRRNMTMTFMARYDAGGDGSSCHVHFSLRSLSGQTVFHDPEREHGISDTMRHFIGGLQRKLPEMFLMMAPNVNSYKRFIPGIFAPVAMTWGVDNRTAAIRAIIGDPGSQRIENRVPGADANPYLTLACMLGAGLWGIEHTAEPTPDAKGSIYEAMDSISKDLQFPGTFAESIERFRNSALAADLFGSEFVRIYSANRAEQDLDFRRAVTDWERRRFLELA